MEALPHSEPLAPTLQDAFHLLAHDLRAALPPVSDTPEDLVRRDNAAIAMVASLRPVNADEANLAVLYVAASTYARHCIGLAREYAADPAAAMKCAAQATSMLRQARGLRSLLLRVQAERRKLEADPVAADKADWTELCVTGMMTQALTGVPQAVPEPPPSPPPEPMQAAAAPPVPLTEAEQYAVMYPKRAAEIRALGGLPDKLTYGPPSPELVHAIVTGTSPILLELDRTSGA